MIVERFPELRNLPPDEQLQLASELARAAVRTDNITELSAETVRMLEAQLDEVLQNPEKGTHWEDLKGSRHG